MLFAARYFFEELQHEDFQDLLFSRRLCAMPFEVQARAIQIDISEPTPDRTCRSRSPFHCKPPRCRRYDKGAQQAGHPKIWAAIPEAAPRGSPSYRPTDHPAARLVARPTTRFRRRPSHHSPIRPTTSRATPGAASEACPTPVIHASHRADFTLSTSPPWLLPTAYPRYWGLLFTSSHDQSIPSSPALSANLFPHQLLSRSHCFSLDSLLQRPTHLSYPLTQR
ncbi:hypothetical protein K461DRAFT_31021 [Myriangium duriaei CBS 260.36]|uniref:Uncharacterized protein n=1 Tax=Myriangium duriaei CBS 260.36 TaxID=1168546 RepID=A0A9P4JG08_9PEZI|nr:hypothetical protein K461DRAFT_31021 [Myriangium duriaei CBS 260.36]